MPIRKRTRSGYVQPSLFAGSGLAFFTRKKTKSKRVLATQGKVFPLTGERRYANPLGINALGRRARTMRTAKRKKTG